VVLQGYPPSSFPRVPPLRAFMCCSPAPGTSIPWVPMRGAWRQRHLMWLVGVLTHLMWLVGVSHHRSPTLAPTHPAVAPRLSGCMPPSHSIATHPPPPLTLRPLLSGDIGEDPNDIPNNLMPYIQQVCVSTANGCGGERKEVDLAASHRKGRGMGSCGGVEGGVLLHTF
jgi:hypothetical protein